jgi:hypothetical protein
LPKLPRLPKFRMLGGNPKGRLTPDFSLLAILAVLAILAMGHRTA